MRISELATVTGVPVATIKYYLREKLLPEGERTSATQAVYGQAHVERLRLIRALVDSGVGIASARQVVAALDDPPDNPNHLLGMAHAAISPPVDEDLDPTAAQELIRRWGWAPETCTPQQVAGVARALDSIERGGFAIPETTMDAYLVGIRQMVEAEIDAIPTTSAEDAVRYVVLGTVLVEPLLLALRRVAEEHVSGERFGGADT
ncbi:MerR family transcriptional regulator [Microbacterium sp. NPDC077663]|uniref:MerR family transcriptional regulator n=1 Tax=Microbacterium sp. NPDC077663 TaxID=3364189 RepID=UPI0037CC9358